MRSAKVNVNSIFAGILEELPRGHYRFTYDDHYQGPPVSLTMPTKNKIYNYSHFPAFFEGLLPEGAQLEALLRQCKLDKHDFFGQLLQVGHDVVGAVTIEEIQ